MLNRRQIRRIQIRRIPTYISPPFGLTEGKTFLPIYIFLRQGLIGQSS